MFRIFALAAMATLAMTQDYPKPKVPSEYVVEVIDRDFMSLKPTGFTSIEKKSSKLNKISLTSGKTDAQGTHIDFARITDGNAKVNIQWQQGQQCETLPNNGVNVSQQIEEMF